MELKSISNNETEITTEKGTRILFSYETPVAVINSQGCFTTEKKYSNTTTQHINKWFGDLPYIFVPESVINLLTENHHIAVATVLTQGE